MSQYVCPTQKGNALITKLVTTQKAIIISQVMFGSGVCPNDVNPRMLENLFGPRHDPSDAGIPKRSAQGTGAWIPY